MKKLLVSTLLLITAISACKKDPSGGPVSLNPDLLVNKWEQTNFSIEYVPETSPKENYNIPPGYIVEFAADGKVYLTDGQAPTVYNGDWSIQADTLTYGPDKYKIVQLTPSNLVYRNSLTVDPNSKIIYTYTYVKK